jgi:hypothetical protein
MASAPRAYQVSGPLPIPYGRNTLYRWEKLGLIKLLRIGGKTLLTDETIEDILSGKIKPPDHPSRLRRPLPAGRAGRPRKPKPEKPAPAAE